MSNFLLQHYLNDSTSRNPEKIAVTDGNSSFSYCDLSNLSNQIAHCLISMGVSRQDHVVICLQRSTNCLPAMLGILKADASYVPLDPKSPAERWTSIIEDSSPEVLICDSKTLASAKTVLTDLGVDIPLLALCELSQLPPENIENVIGLETVSGFETTEPVCLNNPDDIAYVLFTSGSTGRPKGVMITHANVKHYIEWACDRFNIGEQDNVLGTAPFHFDMSTFDIYCTLKSGATLSIANDMHTLFPMKLVDFIEQQQVTVWKGVSSLLMYMSRAGVLKQGAMPQLKHVIFAGETFPTKYLIDWMTLLPNKNYYNAYGPTEATGVATCYRVDSIPQGPHERIPIGTTRYGTKVLLLSEDHDKVPHGEVGELCIAGEGLASGYLNDPAKTSGAFILNPLIETAERIYKTGDLARMLPCGNLEYIGRKDRQLKYMGYRIEAGEIEHALLSVAQIKEAVVDLLEMNLGEGDLVLVAFWQSDQEIDVATISRELKKQLPDYMLPKRFHRVEEMPRCERGKIKLDALKQYHHKTMS